MPIRSDVVIIGGGLAGIMVARKLSSAGVSNAIVDTSVVAESSGLGGFARFSGAKLSPPPAGLGLCRLVGKEHFISAYSQVVSELGLDDSLTLSSSDIQESADSHLYSDLRLRKYSSLVLSKAQMGDLIGRITVFGRDTLLIDGRCISLSTDGSRWSIEVSSNSCVDPIVLESSSVFFAGGRMGSGLLDDVGVVPRNGKGVDLGVRFEFDDEDALSGLRSLSTDAKIFKGNCRTFCVNAPGVMFRYPFGDISIAGGVVGNEGCGQANFGILFRSHDKVGKIKRIFEYFKDREDDADNLCFSITGEGFGSATEAMATLFGQDVLLELLDFQSCLAASGLIDWSKRHTVHFPLLDWHWPVYGRGDGFSTDVPSLFVAGDVAGHARGLLQAAVSGWLAAEEFLQCR